MALQKPGSGKPTSDKPTKEALQVELQGLLATAHGDIKEAAESIAKALDKLIKKNTESNRQQFEIVIDQVMGIPKSPKSKQALDTILERAKEYLTEVIYHYNALNESIKQENKKKKERIKSLEEENRGTTPGRRRF